jgi:hypothetical protein
MIFWALADRSWFIKESNVNLSWGQSSVKRFYEFWVAWTLGNKRDLGAG